MTRFQLTDAGFKSFGDLFNDILNEVPRTAHSFFPRANIFETNEDFQIEMLVPGRKKEDFKISLEKNLLNVAFTAGEEEKDEKRKAIKKEFSLRSFNRSFSVDEKIDAEAIAARYDNGILTIALPKKEEVKVMPKEIAVQ